MSQSDAGKGDRPRPVDRRKWDRGWKRIKKGKKCFCKMIEIVIIDPSEYEVVEGTAFVK